MITGNRENVLLTLCVLALVVVCFLSVYRPMNFDREQARRERVVKERLVQIRRAEEHYRQQHGIYAADFALLTQSGLLADSLTYIPYTDAQRFELATTVQIEQSGRQVPLMECGAQYQQYLDGLDDNSVANLIEAANEAGRYPGLRIGDLSTPNNNAGSWE